MRKRLTKRTVDATKPKKDRDVFVCDGDPTGFGLRVRPSGTKTYVLKWSRGHRGTSRKVTIGRHGRPCGAA